MTESGWLEDDSRLFADLGKVFTPSREEMLRVLLDHVPARRDETFLVVDMGCGQGWLSEAVLRELPNSRVLAEVRCRSLELTGDERAYRIFVDRRWNWYKHPDPADKPSGVAEQVRWLGEAGFEGVDLPWARAGHAVFCAYRPTR